MRFSLTKSLVVLAVLSGVDARPAPESLWARFLNGGSVQNRAVKDTEVKIPKAEIPVTTVKAPESTVQMLVLSSIP